MAAVPRRRGTLDQVLINAAMDLFASYGYRGTSLARIARAAGVTKGALYWHFTDKEDFFLAVAERVLQEWNKAFAHAGPIDTPAGFRDYFLKIFETSAELNVTNPWVSRLLMIITLESHKIGPPVLRAMRKANKGQLQHLREAIDLGKRLGVFASSLEVDWAATQVWSALVGHQFLWYLHGARFELRKSFRRQAREFLLQWSAAK
ncbi:MAG TPA: TetR/AcrR family transcriptional regulator [Candidatus Binataceae bacterium]|nr:TetR/AcrR family transcriptional regulator [Candidatus Binataceae bacterium]